MIGRLGPAKQRHRFLDARRIRLGRRPIRAMHPGIGAGIGRLADQDVLRQIDNHRARPPAARDVERLVHHPRQVFRPLDQVVVLGRRPGDPGRVRLLEGVVADQMRRHLPGQAHDRHAVHQRIDQPGDRIGRPRPARHQHHANPAGAPRIAFRRMHRRLLVPDQDVTDAVLLEQRVIDRQDCTARIAENNLDILLAQRAQQDFGPRSVGRFASCGGTNQPQRGTSTRIASESYNFFSIAF